MNSVFIAGTSTAGKSTSANKLAIEFSIEYVSGDALRGEMVKDPKLEPWVNFYHNQNESEYFMTTSYEKYWQDSVNQSEAIWPAMKEMIQDKILKKRIFIFESINLLPHLIKELPLKGIVMIGKSEEEIFSCLKNNPRWGQKNLFSDLRQNTFLSRAVVINVRRTSIITRYLATILRQRIHYACL